MSLIRAIFAWLLLLAIPVQGFAATAMLFCASGHSGMVAAAIEKPAVHQLHTEATDIGSYQHAGEVQALPHEHEAAKVAFSAQAVDADQHHSPVMKVSKTRDGKCSACAACCLGSMMVGTQSYTPVAMAGATLIPFAWESFASYIPEGVDPPPRSFLA